MKKNLKICFLTAMTAFLLSGCSGQQAPSESPSDGQSYTIGIGQFAAHGSLDNCREGFLLGLAQEGLVEGENLTVLYENAQADGGIASQIITNFASQKVDLICGIATPMAQTAYGVGKKQNIPVIYTAVTDPVAAELAGSDGVPVGEITGTSETSCDPAASDDTHLAS